MNDMTFEQIMSEVWRLSESDRPAATEMLESMREHASFFPWGAHALMANYRALGREDDARSLARASGERSPDFATSWWLQVTLARGTSDYHGVCARILASSRKQALTKAMFVPVIESLLTVREDAESVAQSFIDAQLASEAYAATVLRITGFLSSVHSEIETLCAVRPETWSFVICGGTGTVLLKGSTALVNLSPLKLETLEGWDLGLAERMTVATSALFGWAPYLDDRGVSSWSTVSTEDRFVAAFWRWASVPTGWLSLKSLEPQNNGDASGPAVQPVMVRRSFTGRPAGHLFVRVGNVESWALWSALLDLPAAKAAAEAAAERALSASRKGEKLTAQYKQPWFNVEDNITRLNMNAGWYAKPGLAAASFSDWAARYGAALCSGELIGGHEVELLPIASMLPGFRNQVPIAWSEQLLLNILDKGRIVFVTSFADEIRRHYNSGELGALWKDLGFSADVRSLKTVAAPMSIWPYYPHDSWSQSFNTVCHESTQTIAESRATVFVAACGAYGVPLAHEIHKRFKITCLSYGHHSNIYFGVVTAAGAQNNFYTRKPESEHWLLPDIRERFPEIARLDNGRYVPPRQ
jgi:hypothetical protein